MVDEERLDGIEEQTQPLEPPPGEMTVGQLEALLFVAERPLARR